MTRPVRVLALVVGDRLIPTPDIADLFPASSRCSVRGCTEQAGGGSHCEFHAELLHRETDE